MNRLLRLLSLVGRELGNLNDRLSDHDSRRDAGWLYKVVDNIAAGLYVLGDRPVDDAVTEPIVIDRSRFGGFEIVAVSRPYEKDGDAMVDIGVRLTRWGRVRLFLRKLRTVRVTRS